VTAFAQDPAPADLAGLRNERNRLSAAHADRCATGGYSKKGSYQHHARVIRQMTAKLETG
jgi:hypothetical protein